MGSDKLYTDTDIKAVCIKYFQDDHYIGPGVDIWALGILLYFMVTASMPFNAGTVAALKTLILEGRFRMMIVLTMMMISITMMIMSSSSRLSSPRSGSPCPAT